MQSQNIQAFGIETIVINGDTCAEACEENRNIWKEIIQNGTIILISPEELQNPEFTRLVNKKEFKFRVRFLGIDEIHLLYWWGRSFRPCFRELGAVRARFPLQGDDPIPLIGTTATLRKGPVQDAICLFLGLKPGRYHLLRRSNMRHDIQLNFRALNSGLGGTQFPELKWVLEEGRNTLIFCKTISLGFRVVCYLWAAAKAKGYSNLPDRLRMYNSLNSKQYNECTLNFLNKNQESSITISTDVLSVGWDSQFTEDLT